MQETQETGVQSLGREMATQCSILAWKIPWTEEPWAHRSQAPLSMHTWWSRQKQRAVKAILCPSAGAPPHIQYVSVVPTTTSPRWYMFSFVLGLLSHWLTQLDSTQRGWEAEWRENSRETPAWEDHRMMIATAIARWWSQENSDCSSSWDIAKRKQSSVPKPRGAEWCFSCKAAQSSLVPSWADLTSLLSVGFRTRAPWGIWWKMGGVAVTCSP